MKLLGETLELFPRRTYLQSVLTHLKQAHDLPEVWYLDLRPAGPKFIVITNPDLAAQVTTATAYPQSPLVRDFFAHNLGPDFIETTNGKLWKDLHQMLAPGLTPTAIRAQHDVIVEEADALHTRLQAMADSGDLCKNFVYEFGKFPFEVVSRVFLGAPLGTQTGTGEVYDVMFKLSLAMSVIAGDKNIFKLAVAKWHEWTTSRKLRQAVASHVTPRFQELREKKIVPNRSNAASLVDRMLAPHIEAGRPLSKSSLDLILDKYVFSVCRVYFPILPNSPANFTSAVPLVLWPQVLEPRLIRQR